MSEEQMNENIQPESAPASEAPSPEAAPAPQVDTSIYDTQIQQQNDLISQQSQQLQQLQDQFASNPLFQAMQSLNVQQKEPTNPFEQDLGLQNLPDAAKYTYEQQVQSNQKLQQLEAQVQQMAQEKAAIEYQSTLSDLRNQWTGIYGSPEGDSSDEAIDNAIWKSIESDPVLSAQANQALSEQGYLTTDFLAKVSQKMDSDIAANIKDPSKREAFLKNLVQQELQRKDLQNQSMISSNIETNDSGKKTDN